jgi:predicted porin
MKSLPIFRVAVLGCIFALAPFFSAVVFAAEEKKEATGIIEAVTGGKLLLNLRPRYEQVDLATKPENAKAFTLRSLVGWETKPYYGVGITVQAINVAHVTDDFNDDPAQNAASRYPLVPDPDDTDFNQVYLDYTGLPNTRFRVGKQSIKLDNVRFIGNVEFRQVMQVFNGITVENKSLPNTELYFAHLVRVKSIFALQRQAKIEILRGVYKFTPNDALIGYAYFQDDPKLAGAAANVTDLSNRIIGIRADGAHPFGEKFKLLYTAEYAKQNDYADGDDKIDADYMRIGIGPKWGDWFIRLDYEKLASNNGDYAFQTPLGTNHLFQGWADHFLTTPRQGIKDTFVTAGGKIGKATLLAEYHRYKSDTGGINFGDEIDLSLGYQFTKQLSGKIEYAGFNEKDVLVGAARKADLTKTWVTLLFNF